MSAGFVDPPSEKVIGAADADIAIPTVIAAADKLIIDFRCIATSSGERFLKHHASFMAAACYFL
jgi:hypothetical protein